MRTYLEFVCYLCYRGLDLIKKMANWNLMRKAKSLNALSSNLYLNLFKNSPDCYIFMKQLLMYQIHKQFV